MKIYRETEACNWLISQKGGNVARDRIELPLRGKKPKDTG